MRRLFSKPIRFLKRPQVSLLALLVLVAVSALLIHFVALPAYRRAERNRILQRITELDGVWVDLQKEPVRRRLLLTGPNVNDPFLYDLADVIHLFPELTQLDLSQTTVADASFNALLTRRSQIDHYVLFDNKISDEAIAEARQSYPELRIEERQPDPTAAKLAMAPIPKAAVVSLVHDESRQQVLIGTGDGRLHQIGLDQDSKRTSQQKHGDWLFDIAISPSGKWIATGGGDNALSIHRRDDLTTLVSAEGHTEDVHGVVWLDEKRLLTTGDDRTLRLWDFENDFHATVPMLSVAETVDAHDKPIPRLIRIDASSVLTVCRDHTLRRWVVGPNGMQLSQTYVGHNDDGMDASINPDQTELASVGYDGQMILWDMESSEVNAQHQLGDERLFSLAVDWPNRHALVGSQSGLRLVELDSGRVLAKDATQTFVSRIVRCEQSWLTSDGFGRVIQRAPITLAPNRRAIMLENDYDLLQNRGFQLVARRR